MTATGEDDRTDYDHNKTATQTTTGHPFVTRALAN